MSHVYLVIRYDNCKIIAAFKNEDDANKLRDDMNGSNRDNLAFYVMKIEVE